MNTNAETIYLPASAFRQKKASTVSLAYPDTAVEEHPDSRFLTALGFRRHAFWKIIFSRTEDVILIAFENVSFDSPDRRYQRDTIIDSCLNYFSCGFCVHSCHPHTARNNTRSH